jgi:predicted glycosyltransferase
MTRILLAEDEPVLARNIAQSLRKSGAQVLHAPSAAAAREALSGEVFNLFIADISLGDGNGLDVIGEAAGRLQNTPVIVMTGQDSVQNRARAEGLPVAAFVSKPFALSRMCELAAALTSGTGPNEARKGPSVVMYSHDTIGLGHMRRNSAIARELVERVPGLSVLMLVGCPAGMVFETRPGIDYVKLPSLSKLGRGMFQAGSLRLDAETTRDLRARIIESVLSTIQPDLFLVDHEPAGAMDELLPALTLLKRLGTSTVLGLRDILDAPERTRANWRATGIDRLIAGAYDRVLVYGDPAFFSTRDAYGLDALKPGGVTDCGVVTTDRPVQRHRPMVAPGRIVVSGGGGRDAFPLIEAAIGAVGLLPSRRRPLVTVITGPLMDPELKSEAHRLGEKAKVTVLEHVPDLPALMSMSDLLITMTGYNSINEALAVGCPIITVPRLGPSAEQRLRAEALERHGLARYLRREDLTAERLARLMSEPAARLPREPLNMNGIRNAATVLAGMVETELQKERLHVG